MQPGTHLLLNNLNIVDPEILWNPLSTLYFLDSWGSQQSKERIITGAGPAQAGKSYRAVRTGEFNWRTSENLYVIASIEAPLKKAVWRSKIAIFHTCTTFCLKFSCYIAVGLAVLVHFPPVWYRGSTILLGEIIQAPWIFILNSNNHTAVALHRAWI